MSIVAAAALATPIHAVTPFHAVAAAAVTALTHVTEVPVLAAIQAGVLVRCFIIALVIIIPFRLHRRRQVSGSRGPADDGHAAPDTFDGTRLEDVIASLDDVAASARTDGSATVTVPTGVTVDGAPVDPGTVDALVRDALRRCGLAVVAELDAADGRRLECRPVGGPTERTDDERG